MAWTRIMGAESVRYHRDTVLDRSDDFAVQALAYYGSRGETPMIWGGAVRLGLTGPVTHGDYEAVFGTGGARDPILDGRPVSTKRPGLELVVSAHKSVAVLGVVGRAVWRLQHPTAIDRLVALDTDIMRLEQSTAAPPIEPLVATHRPSTETPLDSQSEGGSPRMAVPGRQPRPFSGPKKPLAALRLVRCAQIERPSEFGADWRGT